MHKVLSIGIERPIWNSLLRPGVKASLTNICDFLTCFSIIKHVYNLL